MCIGMGINQTEDEFDVIADNVAETELVPTSLDIGFRYRRRLRDEIFDYDFST